MNPQKKPLSGKGQGLLSSTGYLLLSLVFFFPVKKANQIKLAKKSQARTKADSIFIT